LDLDCSVRIDRFDWPSCSAVLEKMAEVVNGVFTERSTLE